LCGFSYVKPLSMNEVPQLLVGVEVPVDDVDEAASEAAQGLGVRHAFRLLLAVVRLPRPVETDLGDRDPRTAALS
jgi:hypothetical protein